MLFPFRLSKFFQLIVSFLLLGWTPSAFAIPAKEAFEKFNVVPVFLVVRNNDRPLSRIEDGYLEQAAFLDLEMAKAELLRLVNKTSDPNLQIKAVMLPNILAWLDKRNSPERLRSGANQNQKLPVKLDFVTMPGEMEIAIRLLKNEGVSNASIGKSLRLPVFFTDPFLTVDVNGQPKKLFFLSHSDLKKRIAEQPQSISSRVKIRVIDFADALEEIKNEKEDVYYVVPTPGYADLQSLIDGSDAKQ